MLSDLKQLMPHSGMSDDIAQRNTIYIKPYNMRTPILLTLAFSVILFSCKKDKVEEDSFSVAEALDAKFAVTGTMTEYSTNLFQGYYPHEIILEKKGDKQATMIPVLLGMPGHLIKSNGSSSFYGQYGPVITIDPTTNKITLITNSYGQPSPNGRSATLDPSGINAWNPITKEFRIKYWLDEPAVYMPHRVAFDETWTYLGPK